VRQSQHGRSSSSSNNINRQKQRRVPTVSSSNEFFEKKTSRSKWDPLEAAASIHSERHEVLLKPPKNPISTDRRACGFYLWDALSAGKYHLCRHLLRDCVYEGRGGRRFVRIEPGSLLQLLYPLSQHHPDRCLVCSGTFRDHLTLWWSKHLYTPYDLYLDTVYEKGMFVTEEKEPALVGGTRRQKQQQKRIPPLVKTASAFHRRYVFDLGLFLQIGSQKESVRKRKLKQADDILEPFGPLELRRLEEFKTTYVVPSIQKNLGLSQPLVRVTRSIILRQIDALIARQTLENTLRTIPLF